MTAFPRRASARTLLGIACALCLGIVALTPKHGHCQDFKQVLVLHSYNSGLSWTDSEEAGIRSAFRGRDTDVEIHTEYLDTKFVADDEHFRRYFQLLEHKYEGTDFDVVITTDDDAYNFYLRHHDALFPGVPGVFCGVNYLGNSTPEIEEGLVTGVVESFDIPSTLRVALRQRPQASRVIVINDMTTTGLANKKVISDEVVPRFSDDVTFEFYENLTMAELLGKVRAVSPDDIILLMTFNEDRAGEIFTYDQSIALISEDARAPIYSVWDFYLGKGIVGGLLASGVDQGRIAGEMALRILDGEDVSAIPVVRNGPTRYKFDYTQLRRFDIPTSDVPPGSVVINEPISFYEMYTALVWAAIAGLLGLLTVIAFLLIYIRQRRAGEEALRQSEEKFRTLVDNIDIAVSRTDPSGRYLQVNPAMASIFGYDDPDDLMETRVDDIYQDPEDRRRFLEELRAKGAARNVEMRMKKRDGTPILASLTVTPQYDERGALKWLDNVLEDITERRRAEEELREKDQAIRQAYSDVIDAATGGKLILMTAEELSASLGETVLPPTRLEDEKGLSDARTALRGALGSLAPPPRIIDEYVLAASEALTNVLKYGTGGEYSVRRTKECAQVVVTDYGAGIEFRSLPRATLVPGFSTQMTLGMGFTIMLEVADRVLLTTQPSLTVVVLEVGLAGHDGGGTA